MDEADGAGWGNSTCGEAEGKYILVPHKAMLEPSPTQNIDVEETMGQNPTISSGSHRIVSVTSQGLKLFFVDFGNNGTSDSNLLRNVNRPTFPFSLYTSCSKINPNRGVVISDSNCSEQFCPSSEMQSN